MTKKKYKNPKSNEYVTSAGIGWYELTIEAIKANKEYFDALMKKAEKKVLAERRLKKGQ